MSRQWLAALAAAIMLTAPGFAELPTPGGAPPAPVPAPAPMPGPAPQPVPPPPMAPGVGSQKQLDDAVKAVFVGEWKSQSNMQGAAVEVQIMYRADGSMSGTQRITQYGYTGTYPISGSYVIQAITDKRFVVTIYPQGSMQSSSELQIIDSNTLFNAQANVYAYRVTQ